MNRTIKRGLQLLLIFYLCAIQVVSAQQKNTLRGTIKDEQGAPVKNATIQLLPGGRQVVANEKGMFSLPLNGNDRMIKVTHVNYEEKTVPIPAGSQVMEVVLASKMTDDDEVVVVGYGMQKKTDITNSVSSIDFKELENIPQSNTLNILSGRIAGLNVVQAGGQPGDADNDVTIRGNGTLNDASPLVIIDGVQAALSDLSTLAPSEIANVSVLKDASSAAIYGARGANGVILVTTKTPKEGKFTTTLNSYFGFQEATEVPKFVSAWQWMILHNEASNKDLFPQRAIEDVRNGILTDTFASYEPVKDVFRRAPQYAYNLSLSGGTQAVSFQGSFGYVDQDGILNGTGMNRYNYRANITANVSKKIKMGLNISGNTQRTHENYGGTRGIMQNLYRTYPITPIKYSNGDWGVYNLYNGTTFMPARLYAAIGRTDEVSRTANLLYSLQYNPVKGLTLKSQVAITSQDRTEERFNPTYAYNAPDGTPALVNNINTLILTDVAQNQQQVTNTAAYNLNFGKSRITLLAGQEYVNFKQSRLQSRGSNLPNNEQQVLSRATTDISVSGTKLQRRMLSYFGRINYALQNRYFFEANLRGDGSSRFPETKRYVYLPSASAGWMISNERLFGNTGLREFVDQFKIRAGWGRAGNDRMEPGRGQLEGYTHLQTLNQENYYYFGSQLLPGAAITSFANENISWESTTTTGLGVDLLLFKRTLEITFDVYDRVTDGILFRVPLPPSFGTATPAVQNVAEVSNKGWELTARYNHTASKVNFHIGGNLSFNNNRILSLRGEETVANPFILREGVPFNSFFGLIYEGVIRDSFELKNAPVLTTNGLEIGSMKFRDLNGDGKIDDKDRTVLRSSNIPWSYGISGGLSFKGFSLNFLVQGVQGKYIYLRDWGNRPGNGGIMNFWREWWDNRYDAVNNPAGTWPVMNRSAPGENQTSTFWLHNASYTRLKNVELGYSFSTRFLSRARISNLRLYAAGQNLLTITPLIKQIDPERRADQKENTAYPQVKVVTAGINVTF